MLLGPVRLGRVAWCCVPLFTDTARPQTLFRERQLRALGWHVRTVTFWDWAGVVNRAEDQYEFVARLVTESAAAPESN